MFAVGAAADTSAVDTAAADVVAGTVARDAGVAEWVEHIVAGGSTVLVAIVGSTVLAVMTASATKTKLVVPWMKTRTTTAAAVAVERVALQLHRSNRAVEQPPPHPQPQLQSYFLQTRLPQVVSSTTLRSV